METSSSTDPTTATNGYNVYLIYQKEVYNCDHSFLQSMMDWLYSSVDSPYKFRFRNKAFISIDHNGIQIQKDNLLASLTAPSNSSSASFGNDKNTTSTSTTTAELSNWKSINFNLKHLKEIYVDKRHKDTCVLVSKVSSSSSSSSTSTHHHNYVWKASNPSNYQSFRSPYSLNSAYKKAYLLTIIKFKDGPGRLLQSIQSLDNILADYKSHHSHKSVKAPAKDDDESAPTNTNANMTEKTATRPSIQNYFSDYFSKQQQQKSETKSK